ncbi:AAA family ATPase [Ohessyouella blattaphilus]|uniref:ATP-binding protein n=1 Tax=Ohessyouella blattaphilus TaxID=2949333 RepID=A0ABT1EJ15_9FIRM|nr:ATP-binding protein [Ohessyouella blattaphilus]MCP1110511.1 ATP-binding protein [Ohessyouella blattaphilus]MCR8563905.1 ATP-binding protein [Ohessyouella blattaphilus]MDL2249491.1 ATP-binding protein [Lachnospiraceae bacterium OttesenSCG-928-J05]
MLIDFQVTNFRSFKNENSFSMEKGKNVRKHKNNVMEVGKEKLLKTAVLFGGNANGKTNLINALSVLKYLILQPTLSISQKLPTDTFGYNNENTTFKISFLKNEKRFDYIIEYNELEIAKEILGVNEEIVFDRQAQEFAILPAQLQPLKKNIRKNQNVLFFAQSNNVEEAKIAYSWFLEDLIVVNTDQIPNVLFKSLSEPIFKKEFLKFLRAADFNITDVEVRERKEAQPNIQFDLGEGGPVIQTNPELNYTTVYDVYSTHQSETREFQIHFNNESTGTKVFMFLALYILHNENASKVLLIDEFDRSFHIELAEALLDVFTDEKQTNQFILTTHELSLMDYHLRQDQIWFAEKNQYGETELFSIYDFEDDALRRSDFGYKKRYLEGRFGASQIINKTVLLEVAEGLNGTK